MTVVTLTVDPALIASTLKAALVELRRPLEGNPNGWGQHSYGSTDECKCSAGAIWAAAGGLGVADYDLATNCFALLGTFVKFPESLVSAEGRIVRWNDDDDRTFDEVVAAFEAAITFAEAVAAR